MVQRSRLNTLKGWALVIVCAIPSLVFADPIYRPGPGITDTAIKKQYDCKWFHISQSCILRAKGHDHDEVYRPATNTWVDAGGDYIDLSLTTWTGEGITAGTVGSSANWHMTKRTEESGTEVTATIKDSTASPSADANDSVDATATKTMYAFEVVAYLNSTSSTPAEAGGSPSVSVEETEMKADGTTPVGSKSNTLSLTRDLGNVYGDKPWAPATEDDHLTNKKEGADYGTATWRLDTLPNAATLGTGGQMRVDIGASTTGTFTGTVGDSDFNDGTTTIYVGLAAGSGVQASVSVGIDFGSEVNEGSVAAGFAFSSDAFGDYGSPEVAYKATSKDLEDDYNPLLLPSPNDATTTGNWSFPSKTATIRMTKIEVSRAKAVTSMLMKAKEEYRTYEDSPGGGIMMGQAHAALSSAGSVVYTVGTPTYEQGTVSMPGPEAGY